MRKNGASIRNIENELGIPRSTLSGWLKTVPLSKKQKVTLDNNWREALVHARRKAVKWHNAQKAERLRKAKKSASEFLSKIKDLETVQKTALTFLYLGEGSKTADTSMGSSNPLILQFFISSLTKLYEVPPESMKCELHLRADQNSKKMKTYWSKILGIPRQNFGKTSHDQRTAGKPTYPHYKGVCIVRCGRVAIQRELMYIAEGFCKSV